MNRIDRSDGQDWYDDIFQALLNLYDHKLYTQRKQLRSCCAPVRLETEVCFEACFLNVLENAYIFLEH